MALSMKPFRADDSGFQSNNLWVGSLTPETTESDLTELFGRYGDIDRITVYSSRGFAFIYYRHVEEAVAAKEALQGANLNGSQIKIEYARPAKPCKSLWVGGIGPNVSKDDLEEEFSKFGKIEDFRFLRERKTAFIDYYEMDDALQAKSMNGKPMGGSFLRVDFLRSQAPKKEQWAGSYDNRNGNMNHKPQYPHSYEDFKGDVQPSKVLWIGFPPTATQCNDEQILHNAMILFGEIERVKSYPSRNFALVEFRSAEEARQCKEGLQGRLFNNPRIKIMYSNDELPPEQDDTSFYSGMKRSRTDMFNNDPSFVSSPHSTGIPGSMRPLRGTNERSYNGAEYNDVVGKEPNWRRPSANGTGILPSPTGPGILPSPAQGTRRPMRSNPDSWEGYDPAQLVRESKRTRRDGSVDGFTPMGVDERSFGRGSVAARPIRGPPDSDHIWRGMIAKGGTPVCCARCVPMGKGIETKLPEVVNCSARTDLNMLAKHYAVAIGCEIVFFVPDREEDFASYTEFLRYLSSKDRAGVAKLDDGTTLFLVPPSDFLTDVLQVTRQERLYGVVLKLPPPAVPVTASYRQESQSNPLHYMDQARDSPANASHSLYPPRENYIRGAPEHLTAASKPSVSEPLRIPNNAAPQAGVSLTPELLATLASILPATSQPAAPESHQPMSGPSTVVSTAHQSNGLYNGEAPSQAWKRGPQTVHDASNQSFQQYGNQYTPAGQLPPPPSRYPPASNNPNYTSGMVHGNMQYQSQSVNMPQLSPLPNMPHNNYSMYTQGSSNHPVSQPMVQQYQPEASMPNQNYGPIPSYQQANFHGVTTNQAQNLNPSQFQAAMQPPADKANLEPQNQALRLQPMISGDGQGTTDGEVDKNQRYQSTLQFAANLLLQIQQKQQQQSSGTPAGQGP
ncbi:RNA-binding domain superfamily [Arabidopsis suecica]|uniref:Flowering time control protein FPA n=3 Tax=Arabidopsis TaxID=3701 RepID=FPA_ARATH|nr:RNA binding protein [Arabidopsis thaliana]NP_001078047.1 RNA binding protein [Arabidopsis thaliana]NP_001078048.1 RNA binding protein [Arabidopsis thaliana]Q8LPQ9.2 RecName: Full=Flowering time control protein FPA [Arabidopsis thaliana]KAG7644152.1 RNA-binding domain superfamily [Arabidopsis suecica]AEC10263.1 RNA binding protein [Arabidopsis thaliana]AEC10264.1 RNA binding protein [Arabidopsis thaliana]AEC10265.1 RNA binding protein [Arabidopsis thaliana]|eukprot:NP_001078046.1 RNA binding protein [Arabidopsis thaliana]